jgi:Holliday junction resolvase RusA-like endonuclease
MARRPRPAAPWDAPAQAGLLPDPAPAGPPAGRTPPGASPAGGQAVPAGPVEFVAYGEPKPKGSARAFVFPVKQPAAGGPTHRAVVTHDNRGTKGWQRTVRLAAEAASRGACWATGPVEVRVVFGLLRPPSVSARARPLPTVRPDLDKLVRTVLDGITGVLYRDDAQVVELVTRKHYVTGVPHARVWVGEATT